MITVKFIDKEPSFISLRAAAFYEGEEKIPTELAAAMACKPRIQVIEVISCQKEAVRRSLIARLGKKEASTRKGREEAGAKLYANAVEGIEKSLLLDIRHLEDDGLDIVMGVLLADWTFDMYSTTKKAQQKTSLVQIDVYCLNPVEKEQKFERLRFTAEGVNYARSLTSEPPNVLYPAEYAERIKALREIGVQVEILDDQKLKEIGMSALVAVGKGSCHPPQVAILTWNGNPYEEQPIVVVGKGVCFDSGGLCLKQSTHQIDMKWDKAGAGVVAGLIKTLALAKAPVNIVGILGLVENMPDGAAMKPGDVICTMSQQTVEIVNTDAEGRLVLADCLWYAQKRFNPKKIVDLGTLTIETFASLGNVYAGLYANDQTLVKELKEAGIASGDQLWELPMGPFFAKQIESSVADMKNVGVDLCGENGAAAEFLKRFIIEGTPWAHIDIAGVSWTFEESSGKPKQVTGYGVRLLEEWIMKNIGEKDGI